MARKMDFDKLKAKTLFPSNRLSKADYILGGILLLFCFFAFFQQDIFATGWTSLNYLFGSPLEFYENCKKIQGQGLSPAANYPPAIFLIFAAWLFPFKLLGVIKSPLFFSNYLVYWLKLLTSLVYLMTGFVFYQVTQLFQKDHEWGKFATWIWLTSPLAIFSQFIFSQYDIFYVFLTLLGFLFFLKKKPYSASIIFSLAVTFKYFPFFVFVPLLLFLEKRIIKLLICGLIFLIPMVLIQLLYIHSHAYIEGVLQFGALGRVFSSALELGPQKVYYIFILFIILAGISYYLDVTKNYKKIAAYFFLFSSIYPFLFILWHPQWLLFITPALALTTVLSPKNKISKFLLFDLFGMIFFIAYVVLTFPDNVDLTMFQSKLLHIPLTVPFFENIGNLFKILGGFSVNIFLSFFWGYLVLHLILKYKYLLYDFSVELRFNSYAKVRQRFYIGILIFIIPAAITLIKSTLNSNNYILNQSREKVFGELTRNRVFEQSFKAIGSNLKQVDLFLATFARKNHSIIHLELLTEDHKQLYITKRLAILIQDNNWERFKFPAIKLKKGNTYLLRLTSPNSVSGNAITWWASAKKIYKNGFAVVDGKPQDLDFTFRLKFKNI
ncbi:MAG: DUF2029 domain-containing protein [Gammaproteobacteria bacterium]|nr:MAG: DUF2029 domain-containing protein [Gammaproteobacteria bacterium]